MNRIYKTAKSDTNILNYCDHIYNISDILNLNDKNIQNDRKRLNYWMLYILDLFCFIGIPIIILSFIILVFYISSIITQQSFIRLCFEMLVFKVAIYVISKLISTFL